MLAVPFLNNYTDRFSGHSHEKQGVATGHDLDSNPSSGLMLRGHHELIRVYDFRTVPICFTNSLTGHQNTTEWRTQRQTCAHRVDRAERQEAAMASHRTRQWLSLHRRHNSKIRFSFNEFFVPAVEQRCSPLTTKSQRVAGGCPCRVLEVNKQQTCRSGQIDFPSKFF